MTDARFEDRYAAQLGKRFLGLEKRLPKSVDYYQWIKARQRLAPIEVMDTLTYHGLLQNYDISIREDVRAFYRARKARKMIRTADALDYFGMIK